MQRLCNTCDTRSNLHVRKNKDTWITKCSAASCYCLCDVFRTLANWISYWRTSLLPTISNIDSTVHFECRMLWRFIWVFYLSHLMPFSPTYLLAMMYRSFGHHLHRLANAPDPSPGAVEATEALVKERPPILTEHNGSQILQNSSQDILYGMSNPQSLHLSCGCLWITSTRGSSPITSASNSTCASACTESSHSSRESSKCITSGRPLWSDFWSPWQPQWRHYQARNHPVCSRRCSLQRHANELFLPLDDHVELPYCVEGVYVPRAAEPASKYYNPNSCAWCEYSGH